MRLLSVSEPTLEMLPLTPLTAVYDGSAGSTCTGLLTPTPGTSISIAVRTPATAIRPRLIIDSPLSWVLPRIRGSRFNGVTTLLQISYATPLPVVEPVPDPSHRFDAWLRELRSRELRAKPRHVDVNRAGLDEAVLPPDEVEELLSAEHSTRRAGQSRQELELLPRELHDAAAHLDLEAVAVDLEVPDLEIVLGLARAGHLTAPEHRPHPGEQLPRRERLGHVIVGSHLEAQDLIALLRATREHDHGDVPRLRILLQAPADFPAVELGDHDVEKDQLGSHLAHLLERVGAIAGQPDVIALLGQVVANQLCHVLLVLDHQDASESRGSRGLARRSPDLSHGASSLTLYFTRRGSPTGVTAR